MKAANRFGLHPAAAQALVLACGALGGWATAAAGIPAGWLSGAMFASAALAAARVSAPFSDNVRRTALTGSGIAIGSAITPASLHGFIDYPATMALMAASVAGVTWSGTRLLSRIPGWTRETAFFASVPGALSYVFAVAVDVEEADLPRIAVVQVMRVFFLMGLVPLVVAETGAPLAPLRVAIVDPPLTLLILIVLGAALGYVLERRRVAAGMMFGGMIVAGVAHASGLAPGRPPLTFTEAAQILVGAWIGARFIGFDWGLFGRSVAASIVSFAVAMTICGTCAAVAHHVLGVGFAQSLVAFSPGGLEAMSLLAIALGLDPLFVSTHHLARFILISVTLPWVLKRWILSPAQHDDDPSLA
jgi:membrane AbrB-like protein